MKRSERSKKHGDLGHAHPTRWLNNIDHLQWMAKMISLSSYTMVQPILKIYFFFFSKQTILKMASN